VDGYLIMSTEDKSRELLSKSRLEEENLHENMINRAIEAEISHDAHLEEKAREILAEARQQTSHLQDNMLERTEQELEA
jgi:vacuolar-type H+-ATPase subunit H